MFMIYAADSKLTCEKAASGTKRSKITASFFILAKMGKRCFSGVISRFYQFPAFNNVVRVVENEQFGSSGPNNGLGQNFTTIHFKVLKPIIFPRVKQRN